MGIRNCMKIKAEKRLPLIKMLIFGTNMSNFMAIHSCPGLGLTVVVFLSCLSFEMHVAQNVSQLYICYRSGKKVYA